MIHLNHNHSSSIPGPANPQNLILSGSPHADQHRILPWGSPSREARPFYSDSQDQHVAPDPSKQPAPSSSLQPDKPSDSSPSAATSQAPPSATPSDTQDPSLPQPSPATPAGGPSPPADSSSSLTPPPDATTPHHAMDAPDDPPGQTTATTNGDPDTTEKPGEHQQLPAAGASTGSAADDTDKASRQSTPLSELSSAPETAPDDEAPGSAKESGDGGADGRHGADASSSGGGSASQQKGSSDPVAAPSVAAKDSPARPQNASSALADAAAGVQLASAVGAHIKTEPLRNSASPAQGTPGKALVLDPKVVTILELNALLLRCVYSRLVRVALADDVAEYQWNIKLEESL